MNDEIATQHEITYTVPSEDFDNSWFGEAISDFVDATFPQKTSPKYQSCGSKAEPIVLCFLVYGCGTLWDGFKSSLFNWWLVEASIRRV